MTENTKPVKGEYRFRRPDDMHVHVRQGEMLQAVVPHTARVFARAVIMPNTMPPITRPEQLREYRYQILQAAAKGDPGGAKRGQAAGGGVEAGAGHAPDGARKEAGTDPAFADPATGFTPLMTVKLIPSLAPEALDDLIAAGAISGKLYPEGATTNSTDGVSDIRDIYPLLEAMQDRDMLLNIHGEDPGVFSLEREAAFLPVLRQLRRDFPRLRIVLEHLTTAAAVEAVAELPNTAGTITLHHLELTLDDVLGAELRPHFFCKPIAKRASDRDALQRAALSGSPNYFFGSDSAPHPAAHKLAASARAGIFSAPAAYEGLLQFFAGHDALERIEDFTSRFGAEFYGLPLNRDEIVVRRQDWTVPDDISGVVAYHGGERLGFRAARVDRD